MTLYITSTNVNIQYLNFEMYIHGICMYVPLQCVCTVISHVNTLFNRYIQVYTLDMFEYTR